MSAKNRISDIKILSLFYAFEHEGMIRANYLENDFHWFCAKNPGDFYPIDSANLDFREKESIIYIMNAVERHAQACLPLQIIPREQKIRKIIKLIADRISFIKSKEDKSLLEKVQKKFVNIVGH